VTAADFEWGMGPRHGGFVAGSSEERRRRILEDPRPRFREYYLLPGNLLTWFALYGGDGVPPRDSWVWSWFPDGDRWRAAVDEHGTRAVEVATAATEGGDEAGGVPPSAFLAPNATSPVSFADDDNDAESSVAIFYHVSLSVAEAQDVVAQQMEIAANSHAAGSSSGGDSGPVPLYYTVTGGTAENLPRFVERICEKYDSVACHLMHSFERDWKGETLQQLHRYCQSYPSHRVVYLTNRGPRQLGRDATNVIRSMTAAVTSDMCLGGAVQAETTCNVCGLAFYTQPAPHFPGNMFAASCDYVNQLLAPNQFEERMRDVIGEALLAKVRTILTSNLFPDSPETMGLDEHAVDHWIGSHPTIRPCDVAPAKRRGWFSWLTAGDSSTDDLWQTANSLDLLDAFQLSMAPHRVGAPFGFNATLERRIQSDEGLRRREYYYLAGLLFKWYALYEAAPPADSWVWSWFPEGSAWRRGVENHGANVVKELTEEFVDDGIPH
jgi:hypothetical protein